MAELKVMDSVWFDKIGIVKTYNGFETKWYIGVGAGMNQTADEQVIAQYGMPIHPEMLQNFFKDVKPCM
jgi:hypothetical protein